MDADHLQRLVRLLGGMLWSRCFVAEAHERDWRYSDSEERRNKRNEEDRRQWDRILEGLIDGTITIETMADCGVDTPYCRGEILRRSGLPVED